MGVLAEALAGQDKQPNPETGHSGNFKKLDDGSYFVCICCDGEEKTYSAKDIKELSKIIKESAEPEKPEETNELELERDENGTPSYAAGGMVTEKGFVEPGEFVIPAAAVSGLQAGLGSQMTKARPLAMGAAPKMPRNVQI